MVELKLEALDFDNAAGDTYVAVRVGENQKLSRLSAVRNFKFPHTVVGDRRYGKVDIFKRIGSASVAIRKDPEKSNAQELAVACNEGTNLNFRVTLGGEPVFSEKPAAGSHPAVVEAKSYLVEHNLEMLLSDAMQAVLRERPTNPSQFIAEKLSKSAGAYSTAPAEGRAQTAPAGDSNYAGAPAPDTEKLRLQAKDTLLQATSNGALDAALTKLKDSKAAAAPDAAADAAAQAPNTEKLRMQAKTTLLEASSNGALDAALAKLKKEPNPAPPGAPAPPDSAQPAPAGDSAPAPAPAGEDSAPAPAGDESAPEPAAVEQPEG